MCYICNVDFAQGGAEIIHVLEIAAGLARRGHRVRLVAPAPGRLTDRPPPALSEANRLEVTYLPVAFGRGHVATAFNATLAAYLPWLSATFRPHVYYMREAYRVVAPALAARATRTPLVVEVNGIQSAETALAGIPPDRITPRLQRLIYRNAAAVIAVTDGVRDHLVQEFQVPPERITVLTNGVNVGAFRPLDRDAVKRELGLDGAPVVGYIGNFEVWQGIDELLRAAPRVLAVRPETQFVLAGSGPREPEYRALARRLGVEQAVRFAGWVPVAESPRWINAFDVAVTLKRPLASGYSPLKLYAYMGCGRPVVASRLPGFEDLETHGAGILVPHDDSEAAAGAILRLLADPARGEAMGAAGRALAVARHSWEHVVEETEQICRSVSGRRS